MIKAFLFDYDGVITKGADNDRIFKDLAANLNISIEQASSWMGQVWGPYMRGKVTEQEVWTHLERKYGKSIDKAKRDVWFTRKEAEPLPEMIELVQSLKAHGFTVGMLSNAFKETAHMIQEHGGYDAFDFKILSSEVGYAKPEEEIFHIALEKVPNASPYEVVFLDDREKNVAAANQLGMLGIYVTNHVNAIRKVTELANINGA